MIDEGAIATISELCSTKTDEFTVTNLAIALVNLTRINGEFFMDPVSNNRVLTVLLIS